VRLIFSRKGFDTGSGGYPSPIVDGRPISLPIPTSRRSETSYAQLGLGEIVERTTRGKIGPDHLCHEDPMFVGDECIFGQCGAAQSHLANQGVGLGDVFLFFGLFRDEKTAERHHRIFGYLRVDEVIGTPTAAKLGGLSRTHPHTLGDWNANNTVYRGPGRACRLAHGSLRLTQAGGPVQHWVVPEWLRDMGLSFHGKPDRWLAKDRLQIVARGQEFVANIGTDSEPRRWLDAVIEATEA
jgi:hypothetical protein